MNRIHTSTLRIDWPCYSLPIMDMCVCGEWGGSSVAVVWWWGGASTSPPSLPLLQCCHRLSKAAEAPHAVTDSHADKHLSMKYPCCDRQSLNVRDARPISVYEVLCPTLCLYGCLYVCTFLYIMYVWASALCIRLYNNLAPVIRSMQFHYCTVSNPGLNQ